MALSVDIHRLLKGGAVEWERIDFRKNFHALSVLRSICAFANDLGNTGGGYIIIGVEQDKDHHLPIFPVRGLSPGEITIFTQEIARICKHLYPPYYPIVETADFRNKQLLVLWMPVGPNRPYQVPQGLIKPSNYSFYVRTRWSTRKASSHEQLELIAQANQIPFDAQSHYLADITDLNITLIQSYLAAIKSSLSAKSEDMPFFDLCKRMNIASEIKDEIKPKNAGLLLFSNCPDKFFPGAFIELTEFDGLGRYREKVFTGPLFTQIETALTYIKGMVITKIGKEHPKASEDTESFNYPFAAVKEALINAVFHRDYKENAPIEIRIKPKGIEIISFPGPLPPLDNQKLKIMAISVRRIRNPALGHFLKQMGFVQGKVTGLEKICFLMQNNGNPAPTFETDKKRRFFKVFLPIHPEFASQEPVLGPRPKPARGIYEIVLSLSQVCPKSLDLKMAALVLLTAREKVSLEDLMFKLNQTNKSRFRNDCIKPLMAFDYLQYTRPDRPKHGKQKYILTPKGRALIEDEKTF